MRLVGRSGLFDAAFYLSQNEDVRKTGVDPLLHYLRHGGAEGRDPSLRFDTSHYIESHPDVCTSGLAPLLHYLLYGEGRDWEVRRPEADEMREKPSWAEVLERRSSTRRRVLIIEPTPSHQEVLPTVVHLFDELGFDADVLTRDSALSHRRIEGFLSRVCPGTTVQCVLNVSNARLVASALSEVDYDVVFFTTLYEYWLRDPFLRELRLPDLPRLALVHEPAKLHRRHGDLRHLAIADSRLLALSQGLEKVSGLPVLAPTFFSEASPPYQLPLSDGGVVRFAVPGNVDTAKRDYDQLLELAAHLAGDERVAQRCEIVVLGGRFRDPRLFDGFVEEVARRGLGRVLRVTGHIGFDDLFRELRRCHHLLFLLNPDREEQRIYLHEKTTGALALALGFSLGMVLHETFARAWQVQGLAIGYDSTASLKERVTELILNQRAHVSVRRRAHAHNRKLLDQSFENLRGGLVRAGVLAANDELAAVRSLLREERAARASLEERCGRYPPGHPHSPLPDFDAAAEIEVSQSYEGPIDLRVPAQLRLLAQLGAYNTEMPFDAAPKPGLRYHLDNLFFPHFDGLLLYALLRHLKPRRFVEVGSGFSSACALDTAERFLPDPVAWTFTEPAPARLRSLLRSEDLACVTLLERPVQEVALDVFLQLRANDILFVDSSHVVRHGGDVNRLLFEILPRLASGVVVHVHDVFYPFEYPSSWLQDGRAWTELYLLRAALEHNPELEILLFADQLLRLHRAEVEASMPLASRQASSATTLPGSLWLRRV